MSGLGSLGVLSGENAQNLVQERTGIATSGSMPPISGVYQRRSISPLLIAFPGKTKTIPMRPVRVSHKMSANSPSRTSEGRTRKQKHLGTPPKNHVK